MKKKSAAPRQKKYKIDNEARGLKRVGVVVPIVKADRIKTIAKRMREKFKANKK